MLHVHRAAREARGVLLRLVGRQAERGEQQPLACVAASLAAVE